MPASIVRRPSLGALAIVFSRFGNSTFGGGTATIVELEREIVDRRQWLARGDSQLAYAIARLTPGTNLLAWCAAVGWRIRGVAGALAVLIAASFPSAVMATILTRFFATWASHPLTASALKGALAAAIAIMIGTVWTMIGATLGKGHGRRTFLIASVAFCLSSVLALTPVQVLLASALVGVIWTEQEPP